MQVACIMGARAECWRLPHFLSFGVMCCQVDMSVKGEWVAGRLKEAVAARQAAAKELAQADAMAAEVTERLVVVQGGRGGGIHHEAGFSRLCVMMHEGPHTN